MTHRVVIVCIQQASLRTYRMMSIQRVRCRFRGARASRVLAITSHDRGLFEDCFGETPKPIRETRVLPGGPRLPLIAADPLGIAFLTRFNHSGAIVWAR